MGRTGGEGGGSMLNVGEKVEVGCGSGRRDARRRKTLGLCEEGGAGRNVPVIINNCIISFCSK